MRIAIIVRTYAMYRGGAERVAVTLSQKLAEGGHDVHIFCGSADGMTEGIKCHIVPFLKFTSILKLLSFHWSVNHLLKNERFDIIYGHCHCFPLDLYYVGGGVHEQWMRIRYPSLWIRLLKYLSSPRHIALICMEKKIFQKNNFKVIVTNSLLVKHHVVNNFLVPEKQIRVIYDGLDHSVFNIDCRKYRSHMRQKHNANDNDIVVLFVSNNWSRKGLVTILKAMTKLPPDFKIVIVGRGNPKRFNKNITELRLERDRIIFAGTTREIQRYYGMADIFVLPTMYDPFSNVCREAMATGLPVITTKANGASEIIAHGESGYVLEHWNDHDTLSEQLQKLRDPLLREQMGSRACHRVQSFTWENNIREHVALFKEYVNE